VALALETDDKDEVLQALMAGMKAFNGAAVPNLNSHKIVAAIRDATGLPLQRVPVRPEHITGT